MCTLSGAPTLPSTHSSCPAQEGALGGKWCWPAPGHTPASPGLLPWKAGEGAGRLRGFGGRSGSWERFSHGCPGRGECSRLRHAAAPSPASTATFPFPLCIGMPGNPFSRCQLSWEPRQCQHSRFPPGPTNNQGFLPPLSAQPVLCSPWLHHCTQQDAHRPPLSRAQAPQTESHPAQRGVGHLHKGPSSIPQHLPACSTKDLSSSLASKYRDVPHSIQLPRRQPLPWLQRKQLRTTVSQPA